MQAYLWVALGGALGSVGRFWCAETIARYAGTAFPWGTLLVNVVGSFVIGVVAGLAAPGGRLDVPLSVQQFVVVGILGGFTTFSAFSVQTLGLLQKGALGAAAMNVVGSVALCLGAVALGWAAAAVLGQLKGG